MVKLLTCSQLVSVVNAFKQGNTTMMTSRHRQNRAQLDFD